jgi:hypothetical protein
MNIDKHQLVFSRTLEYFEGDILSEYSCGDKVYVKKWCDVDPRGQVSIVTETTKDNIERFLNKEISMRELCGCDTKAPCWKVVDCGDKVFETTLMTQDQVPELYKPASTSFYDESLAYDN